MIIYTDKMGKIAIEQLCDIALKQAGVKNLDAVNMILASIKLLEAKEIPKSKSNPVDVKKEVQSKTEKVEKEKKTTQKKKSATQGSLSVSKVRRKTKN